MDKEKVQSQIPEGAYLVFSISGGFTECGHNGRAIYLNHDPKKGNFGFEILYGWFCEQCMHVTLYEPTNDVRLSPIITQDEPDLDLNSDPLEDGKYSLTWGLS